MSRIALLLIICLFAAGCGGEQAAKETRVISPQIKTSESGVARTKLEMRPEESGELSRLHKFDDTDLEIGVEITYKNGLMRHNVLDTLTGKVRESKLFHPGQSKVAAHSKFAADGKNIVWNDAFYKSGKQLRTIRTNASGEREMHMYLEDGQVNFYTLLRKDGSGSHKEWLQYRNDTSVVLRYECKWTADNKFEETMYDYADGRIQHTHRRSGTNQETLRYDKSGKLFMRQYFKFTDPANPFWPSEFVKAELLGDDESTVVATVYCPKDKTGFSAPGTVIIESDEGKREILFGAGWEAISDKHFDKNGKLLKEQAAKHLEDPLGKRVQKNLTALFSRESGPGVASLKGYVDAFTANVQ
ncbi:MAG: hypothetical protein K2W82_18085 [Candidatus Obscuribacterales bacterium]|nr:hypothetical protein [Candidatus Obscuribacterales bacterium]